MVLIGLFDSGVGGFSIASALRRRLPTSDLLYIADRARAPWGTKSDEQILEMSIELTDRLIDLGSELVVVACHTGSVVALESLRRRHPQIPFVGLDPAIKPAASLGNGTVAVLATPTTLRSRSYQKLVNTHATGVEVVAVPCPRWVELVESGITSGPLAEELVGEVLDPLKHKGINTFVLACTHFPFLENVIRQRIGSEAVLVAPTEGVVRQVERLAKGESGIGNTKVISTGPEDGVVQTVAVLGGLRVAEKDLTFSS
ncbi:MAG: glutamate racemase [Acidimicrobiia bacterium]|nr:glutamate racemase [Acidimicrobiia bacterium]